MPTEDNEDNMREFPSWMNPADERILEYLRDEGMGTPKMIADRLDKHNNYMGERLRELTDRGLVERPSRGVYKITETGIDWLDEKLPVEDLEDE